MRLRLIACSWVVLTFVGCPDPPVSGDTNDRDSDVFDDQDNNVIPSSGDADAEVESQVGACDDDEDCRGSDPCQVGSCRGGRCELSARVCPDDANPCTDAICRAGVGCDQTPNIATCDDGSACTDHDRCNGGSCVGTPIVCDDDESCTADACDPTTGCVFTAVDDACDDADACTGDDHCEQGRCMPGLPVVCPELAGSFGCARAVCDARQGCGLELVAGTCDDGDVCTSDESCREGACVGALRDCDDHDPCTDDYCDPTLGCTHRDNVGPCEDGDACTVGDRCDAGACVAGALSDTCCACVDDGDACTIDLCTADGCRAADSPVVPDDADGGLLVESFEAELDPARWVLASDNPEVVWQRDSSWSHQAQWSLYLGKSVTYSYDFGATRATATWRGPLPRDAQALALFVRKRVDETSCTYDALEVTLDGVPLGRAVCGSSEGEERWDVRAKAGRVVSIGFVFDTIDGDDNDGEGVWIDAMRFVRTEAAECCEAVGDCAAPARSCETVACTARHCTVDASACP